MNIYIFFHFRSTLIPPRLGSVCEARGEKAKPSLTPLSSPFSPVELLFIHSLIYLFSGCFFFLFFSEQGKLTTLPFFCVCVWHRFRICAQSRRSESRHVWRRIRWKADMRDMRQGKKGDICYFVLSCA